MTVDYKDVAKSWDSQKPSGRSNGKTFWLAVRVAIEKQIPKKPIDKLMYLECPTCGDVGIEDCGYCSVCGQKLDWGNENDGE